MPLIKNVFIKTYDFAGCVCQRLIQSLLLSLYGYDGWVSQSKKCD